MSVNSIDAGRVVDLFKEAVEIVKPNWLMLAVVSLVVAIIAGIVSGIPLLGSIIGPLVLVPLTGGLLLLVRDSANRMPFDFAKLFAPFSNTPMLINLLIIAAPQCVIGLLQMLAAKMGSLSLVMLMVPVALAYAIFSMFAVQRVIFGGKDGITALKESAEGVLKNIVAIIVLLIISVIAGIAGVLALIIGIFFVIPLLQGVLIRMHDEIYGFASAPSGMAPPPPPPPGAPGW